VRNLPARARSASRCFAAETTATAAVVVFYSITLSVRAARVAPPIEQLNSLLLNPNFLDGLFRVAHSRAVDSVE
jgi:hypothetical protein